MGLKRLGVPLPACGGQGRALRGVRPAIGRRTARIAQARRGAPTIPHGVRCVGSDLTPRRRIPLSAGRS